MDVRCPQCETLYEVDERQLRGGGATLKCSQCDHVFRLQTSVALNQENRRRWMLRNTNSGDILYFSAFDQLHKWIMEGEASKDDEISRTGDRWTRLEDIGEFMPVFKAVDSISSLSNAPAVQRSKDAADAAGSSPSNPDALPPSAKNESKQSLDRDSAPHQRPQTGQRSRVRTSQQFPLESAVTNKKAAPVKEDSGPAPRPQNRGARQQSQGRAQSQGAQAQSQAPQQSSTGSQPAINTGQSNQSQGQMRTPASDRARSREQTGAGQVDSGPLAGGPSADDDWSFGDGSGLTEAPGHTTGSYDASQAQSSSSWPVVALLLVLLVVGGAAGVYFVKPDLLDGLLAGGEEKAVPIASDEADEEDEPEPEDGPSPQDVVGSALDAARGATDERETTLFVEAVEPAQITLFDSVAEAKKDADKEAEEPDPDEMLARARRLLERGDSNRARKKYHEILEIQRSNVEAITGLGWSLLAAGSPAAAAAQFRRAKSINPSYGDAYIGLGKAERQLGNKQAALEAYATYLSRFPGGSKASIAKYQKERLEGELGQ